MAKPRGPQEPATPATAPCSSAETAKDAPAIARPRKPHPKALHHHGGGQHPSRLRESHGRESEKHQGHGHTQERKGRKGQALHHHALGQQGGRSGKHHAKAYGLGRVRSGQVEGILKAKAHGLLNQGHAGKHGHADDNEGENARIAVAHLGAKAWGIVSRRLGKKPPEEKAIQKGQGRHYPQRHEEGEDRQGRHRRPQHGPRLFAAPAAPMPLVRFSGLVISAMKAFAAGMVADITAAWTMREATSAANRVVPVIAAERPR